MKQIKLTQGAYRYRPAGEKSAVVVQLGDPPFDVPDEEAARLVSLGVAALVQEDEVIPPQQDISEQAQAETLQEQETSETPAYSLRNTMKELAALMEEYDIPHEEGWTKRQMIEALDLRFQAEEITPEDGAPDLKAVSAVIP